MKLKFLPKFFVSKRKRQVVVGLVGLSVALYTPLVLERFFPNPNQLLSIGYAAAACFVAFATAYVTSLVFVEDIKYVSAKQRDKNNKTKSMENP